MQGALSIAIKLLQAIKHMDAQQSQLKVTMLLSAWGDRPESGGWRDVDGTWVVPVVRLS